LVNQSHFELRKCAYGKMINQNISQQKVYMISSIDAGETIESLKENHLFWSKFLKVNKYRNSRHEQI
jgi:hypothetical protein